MFKLALISFLLLGLSIANAQESNSESDSLVLEVGQRIQVCPWYKDTIKRATIYLNGSGQLIQENEIMDEAFDRTYLNPKIVVRDILNVKDSSLLDRTLAMIRLEFRVIPSKGTFFTIPFEQRGNNPIINLLGIYRIEGKETQYAVIAGRELMTSWFCHDLEKE